MIAGEYTVTLIVENDHGCRDTATKVIDVNDAFTFWIPNAFSPNEDFVNDLFLPTGVGYQEGTFKMRIFDRWGKQLFYTEDIHEGWNGTDEKTGQLQPQGVYTYIIHIYDDGNLMHKYVGIITSFPSKETDQ
jgi:gliding motility-associated-like protein